MLKDVGMTVQKIETQVQYICYNTGIEGSTYAAKQRMNNNNMRKPSLHMELHMLLLLHERV